MENGSLTSSQSHLVQHVLHERHCHVTFSAPFVPSSLSLFFFTLIQFTYLPFGFWPFHLSLSLSSVFPPLLKQSSSDSVTCNIFGLTYQTHWTITLFCSCSCISSCPLFQSRVLIFSSFNLCSYVDTPLSIS